MADKFTPDTAVCAEALGVTYSIPHERVTSFKEHVLNLVARRVTYQDYRALNQVDFILKRGEIFGVIGPNGAGKSTLLKIIAQVLRPTSGRIRVRGKVAPLLGLGAGFHPDLTGMENIYLNGTLLGMTRKQITQNRDRIIDFAGIREFIDCPLRTYSTGMRARLGFSVAMVVEPEILLLDEVLAVGDKSFQEKCISHLKQVFASDMTVIIVSHDLAMVAELCGRALWLQEGAVAMLGEAGEVVEAYRSAG